LDIKTDNNETLKLKEFENSKELRKKVDESRNVGIAFADDLQVKFDY
jgi:hypothetical protein